MSEERRNWAIGIIFLILCASMVVVSLVAVIQQVQIHGLQDQVEYLGLEADTMSAYMRDQNQINMKLIERMKALEVENAVPAVQ